MKKLIFTILMLVGVLTSVTAMACPNCDCGNDCKCKPPCECPKK